MNNERRKDLRRAYSLLEAAEEIIRDAMDDEQEGFDNLPEPIQESEKGEVMEAAVDSMESALEAIEEAKDHVSDAVG